EAHEEQEEREEDAERADEGPNLDARRRIMMPGGRQEILGERSHDDDEALEPHADVDEHADDENGNVVPAQRLDPEDLRRKDVVGHHAIIGPGVPALAVES